MNRGEREAVAAVCEVLGRADCPWRVEKRARHVCVVAAIPGGPRVPIAIPHKPPSGRENQRLLAVREARRLLNTYGRKVPRLATRTPS